MLELDIFTVFTKLIPYSEQRGGAAYTHRAATTKEEFLGSLDYIFSLAKKRPEMSSEAKFLVGGIIQAIAEHPGKGMSLYVYEENEQNLSVGVTQTPQVLDQQSIQDDESMILGIFGANTVRCTIDENGLIVDFRVSGNFSLPTIGADETYQNLLQLQLNKVTTEDKYYLTYIFLTAIQIVAERAGYQKIR